MDYASFEASPNPERRLRWFIKENQKSFSSSPALLRVLVRMLRLLVCKTNAAGLLQRATVETDKQFSLYPPLPTTEILGDKPQTLRLIDSQLYRVSACRQKIVSRLSDYLTIAGVNFTRVVTKIPLWNMLSKIISLRILRSVQTKFSGPIEFS